MQAGDYFTVPGLPTPHRINTVAERCRRADLPLPLGFASSPASARASPYAIVAAPRRLPSEDVIHLPPSLVIDSSVYPQPAGPNSIALCQNCTARTLIDSNNPNRLGGGNRFRSVRRLGGPGHGADKVCSGCRPDAAAPTSGPPLIVSVQIRTGLIGVYPVARGTRVSRIA